MIQPSISTPATATAPQPEPFINRKELARRLGCGIRTTATWTANGLIPYYKLGGKTVVFKWSEIEALLRERCRVWRGRN